MKEEKAQGFNIYFSNEIDFSHDVQEGVDRMNNEFEECIMKYQNNILGNTRSLKDQLIKPYIISKLLIVSTH